MTCKLHSPAETDVLNCFLLIPSKAEGIWFTTYLHYVSECCFLQQPGNKPFSDVHVNWVTVQQRIKFRRNAVPHWHPLVSLYSYYTKACHECEGHNYNIQAKSHVRRGRCLYCIEAESTDWLITLSMPDYDVCKWASHLPEQVKLVDIDELLTKY